MTQEPFDGRRAAIKFADFHDHDPKSNGLFAASLRLPARIHLAGKAIFVTYRTTKGVDPEKHNWKHDHDAGVRIYRPGLRGYPEVAVPAFIRDAETLVLLGSCLGIAYVDARTGEDVLGLNHKGSELYCTPDGHALVVVTSKRRLDAVIWGGKLRTLGRGIVG